MNENERFCTAAKKAFIAMQNRRLGQTPKICFTKMNENEQKCTADRELSKISQSNDCQLNAR
jgi:hypothetical protein